MKTIKNKKTANRTRRHKRIRMRVSGTSEMPRLSVYRSNKAIYAQVINDETGKTIVSATEKDVKGKSKVERAQAVGKLIAERAKENKVGKVVFDRGGFLYAGRVKALAEGAREGGLTF